MHRITMHSTQIRFMAWWAAGVLWVLALLLWGGGFGQLLEYINDLF